MNDRFSKHSSQYAQFRPTYPSLLYEFIFKHVSHFNAVWDCGTGNGQAARDLSVKFKKVFATDISAKQLENAQHIENVSYSISNEQSSFEDNSFDLITVAQAAHWFNMEVFATEVKRVAKSNGVVALWGYGLLSINPEIDVLLGHFYTHVVGPYWDKERRHIDERYKNVFFPFTEIETPPFFISTSWTLPQLKGYLTTWSAVQKYISARNHNPVDDLISQIEPLWKDHIVAVNFPLFLRLGHIQK